MYKISLSEQVNLGNPNQQHKVELAPVNTVVIWT